MQFGTFTVGDIAPDPRTGHTPSEAERLKHIIRTAELADQVGLDVFAIREHHNPPVTISSPTSMLAHIAARTEHVILSTAVTLITTNDPVRIAEDYATVQHLAGGRLDLMIGRGNTVPVYSWFGQNIKEGVPLALEHYGDPHTDQQTWQRLPCAHRQLEREVSGLRVLLGVRPDHIPLMQPQALHRLAGPRHRRAEVHLLRSVELLISLLGLADERHRCAPLTPAASAVTELVALDTVWRTHWPSRRACGTHDADPVEG
ncbi:LLM class flavin-dependent oxidoreductase [Microbacterium sp. LMI12-1-1.1]